MGLPVALVAASRALSQWLILAALILLAAGLVSAPHPAAHAAPVATSSASRAELATHQAIAYVTNRTQTR